MSKLLYIKANCKSEGESRTFRISDKFIEEYKKKNPEDEVITLDLYKENINFLNKEDLNIISAPKNQESKSNPLLKYAYQFVEADKYAIAAPMWNLGFPAILKAYIDYITISGITFDYIKEGAIGLCSGKKGLFITTRGGYYSQGIPKEIDMGERYIEAILSFLGIKDFQTIAAEGLDVLGNDVDKIINNTIEIVEKVANDF